MRPTNFFTFVFRCLAMTALMGSGVLSDLRAQELTTRDIGGRLRETLSALDTVRMRYRLTATRKGVAPFERDVEWLASGNRRKLTSRLGDAPFSWHSFDGHRSYEVSFKPGEPAHVERIVKTNALPDGLKHAQTPAFWIGLQVFGRTGTLADAVTDGRAKVGVEETLEGLRVVRIDLGEHERHPGNSWHYEAVLATDRDWLPLELIARPSKSNVKNDQLRDEVGEYKFTVSDFRLVRDQALDRDCWVPWRMQMHMNLVDLDIQVDSAMVNQSVSDREFLPPQPAPDTYIVDDTIPGRRSVTIHSPKAALADQAAVLAREVQLPVSSTGNLVEAIPPSSGWLTRLAFWTGATTLLGAAVVYTFRNRPRC